LTDYSKSSGKSSGKTENQAFNLLSANPEMTIPELAAWSHHPSRGKTDRKIAEKGPPASHRPRQGRTLAND